MKKLIITVFAVATATAGLSACTDTERAATLGVVAGAATVGAVAVASRRNCYIDAFGYRRCY